MSIPSGSASHAPRRLAGGLAIACMVLLSSAACDDGVGDVDTPTPTASTSTLRAPETSSSPYSDAVAAGNKAIAAYRGMWTAYQKAGETADPNYPELQTYATSEALQTLTSGLTSVRDRGLLLKGEIVLNPRVTGVEPIEKPNSIELTDCADDSKSVLYKKSGEPYSDTPGGRRLILATVKDTGGGTWKVVSFGVRDVGGC